MKNFFIFLILVAIIVTGFIFRDKLNQYSNQFVARISDELPALEQVVFDFSEKSEFDLIGLQREVYTPGPLRNLIDNPNAFLTVIGAIEETNRQRLLLGLPAYESNDLLNEAARIKLQDMFAQEYFEHISPDNVSPGELIESAGYEYVKVGENLALGNYNDDKKLIQAWMESPPHRENILNESYTQIGVAVAQGMFEGEMTWLAVQEFGRPMTLCPSVDKGLVVQIDSGQTELDEMEKKIEGLRDSLQREIPGNQATKDEVDQYNVSVDEYNLMVREYNRKGEELKALVDDYNIQVKDFNTCLKE